MKKEDFVYFWVPRDFFPEVLGFIHRSFPGKAFVLPNEGKWIDAGVHELMLASKEGLESTEAFELLLFQLEMFLSRIESRTPNLSAPLNFDEIEGKWQLVLDAVKPKEESQEDGLWVVPRQIFYLLGVLGFIGLSDFLGDPEENLPTIFMADDMNNWRGFNKWLRELYEHIQGSESR